MIFEAGNEAREKNWSDFVAEQNEEWSEKRVVFCSYRCFLDSEKLRCEKKFCKRANFFCSRAAFYSSFLVKRFWLWFFFNFRRVLVVVWRFLEIYMNFMLIRWFFIYFADFWANFCDFLNFVLFYCLKWALKRTLLLEQFLVYKWLQFCGYEAHFLLRIMTKNGENWNYFS